MWLCTVQSRQKGLTEDTEHRCASTLQCKTSWLTFVKDVGGESGEGRVHPVLDLQPEGPDTQHHQALEQGLAQSSSGGLLAHHHRAQLGQDSGLQFGTHWSYIKQLASDQMSRTTSLSSWKRIRKGIIPVIFARRVTYPSQN